MPEQETCSQRISRHRESRITDFQAFADLADEVHDEQDEEFRDAKLEIDIDENADSREAQEQAQDRVMEYPLAVELKKVVKVQLSTGGPGDWLEVEIDDGQIEGIDYHFNDWFDHAEERLHGIDYDAAKRFCEMLGIPELLEIQ